MIVIGVMLPFTPAAGWFGFVPMPPLLLWAIVAIAACYVAAAELAKAWFYRHAAW